MLHSTPHLAVYFKNTEGAGERDDELRAKLSFKAVKLLSVTIMMDTCHYAFVRTHSVQYKE